MVAGDNERDGNSGAMDRDPRLARLYHAASAEEPPSALDDAILAAARREVGAKPRAAGGGGEPSVPQSSTPVLRAKRTWYVPVSIAAVLVLSVSLVTLVHQEKGEELSQPPRSTVRAPAPPAQPASPDEVPAGRMDTAPAAKDAVSETPKRIDRGDRIEERRAQPPQTAGVPSAERRAEPVRKQVAERAEAYADGNLAAGKARGDQPARPAMPEPAPEAKSAPGALAGAASPAEQARERRPDPFPAMRERETPSVAQAVPPAPPVPPVASAPSGRATADASPRPEADRMTRGEVRQAPALRSPAVTGGSAATLGMRGFDRDSASAAKEASASTADRADDRKAASLPAPSIVAAKPAAAPPPAAKMAARSPVWRGLEEQPPEKWLERLGEFRRDNRGGDADELLAEFRRRFPDHPAARRD